MSPKATDSEPAFVPRSKIVTTIAQHGLRSFLAHLHNSYNVADHANMPTIPALIGDWAVRISHCELQTTRDDTLAPASVTRKRRLMLSLFQPSHRSKDSRCKSIEDPCFPGMQAEYQTEALKRFDMRLDPNQFRRITLTSCKCEIADTAQDNDVESLPLVIFSPGFAASRLSYASICQAVASHGFTVISTDHPYETEWVQYPDGEVVTNGHRDIKSMADVARYAVLDHPMRVEDVRSVLNAVESREVPGIHYDAFISGSEPKLGVGVFGHALGGSTTAGALLADSPRTCRSELRRFATERSGNAGVEQAPASSFPREYTGTGSQRSHMERVICPRRYITVCTCAGYQGTQT